MKRKSYKDMASVSQELVEKAVEAFGKPDFIVESAAGAFLYDERDPGFIELKDSVIKKVDALPGR